MADQVLLTDPYGILQELNPEAPTMVDSKPDIDAALASIAREFPDDYDSRIPKANYLEPLFFHPDQTVQARAASACVSVDVGKLGDYLINVLATATDATTLKAAATAVWQRDESGTGSIDYAVDSLHAYLCPLGLPKVRKIVETLLNYAPDADARTALSDKASSGLGI